jgi:hypothetical protein
MGYLFLNFWLSTPNFVAICMGKRGVPVARPHGGYEKRKKREAQVINTVIDRSRVKEKNALLFY